MDADSIYRLLARRIREMLFNCELDFEELKEIRLRIGRPLLLRYRSGEYTLCPPGLLSDKLTGGYRITENDLRETLEYASGYSLYAFEQEMRQGFLTVPGGHRVGLAGHAVSDENGVRGIRHISYLNIRVSHQRKGCADPVMPFVYENGEVCHTLLISPPGGGKTTLLRDLIRQISDGGIYGAGRTVGVVDERSELAGAYLGVPQNDLGIRTDVIDGCGKAEGMMMLLRAMTPHVIAVDELGSSADGNAVENALYCGCRLIATVHGASIEELERKPLMETLLKSRTFERFVLLSGAQKAGEICAICDGEGTTLTGEAVLQRRGTAPAGEAVLQRRGTTFAGESVLE